MLAATLRPPGLDVQAGGMATSATVSEVRAWARSNGFDIGDRGRLPAEVWDAWDAAAPKATKSTNRPVPAASPPAPAPELLDAQQRISQLETRLHEVCKRLAALEASAGPYSPAPKRLFARGR